MQDPRPAKKARKQSETRLADLPPQIRSTIQSIAEETGVVADAISHKTLVDPVLDAISGRAVRELQSYLRIVVHRMGKGNPPVVSGISHP